MILGSIIQASFILEYHLHLLIQTLLEELCVVAQLLYMLLVLLHLLLECARKNVVNNANSRQGVGKGTLVHYGSAARAADLVRADLVVQEGLLVCQRSVMCVLLLSSKNTTNRRTVERVRVPPHRRH